ncbi:unnamed protein product [Lactuca virosa]|uniref:Uncharacterized protein n=1 Tax=Lactuca virosa TaxID=75947 RepID=A0AAU9LWK6_9ASTR|nr:unnamed protein product [Lactuca virosa]
MLLMEILKLSCTHITRSYRCAIVAQLNFIMDVVMNAAKSSGCLRERLSNAAAAFNAKSQASLKGKNAYFMLCGTD